MREALQQLVEAIKGADFVEVEPDGSEDATDFDRAVWAAERELSREPLPDYRALLVEAYTHLRGLGEDSDLAPLLERIDEALRDR